jgi:hypothetical protein
LGAKWGAIPMRWMLPRYFFFYGTNIPSSGGERQAAELDRQPEGFQAHLCLITATLRPLDCAGTGMVGSKERMRMGATLSGSAGYRQRGMVLLSSDLGVLYHRGGALSIWQYKGVSWEMSRLFGIIWDIFKTTSGERMIPGKPGRVANPVGVMK